MVYIAARPLFAIAFALSRVYPTLAHTQPQCALPVLATRSLSTTMSEDSSAPAQPTPATPEFLQDRLSSLLSAPHIHFNKPPHGGPLGGLRMGPGPVDVFSTRFTNYFTRDATGVVAGNAVDRAALKDALLALQRRWNPDSATFVPEAAAAEGGQVSRLCFC